MSGVCIVRLAGDEHRIFKTVSFGQQSVKKFRVPRGAEMKPYRPAPRDEDYCHDDWTKKRKHKASTKAALHRATKLSKTVGTHFLTKPTKTKEDATALPVRGGTWIIDSGSAFDIVSPGDLTQKEKGRIEQMSADVKLRTAAGDLTTNQSVLVSPFGEDTSIDALVLPDSPALLPSEDYAVKMAIPSTGPVGAFPQ